MTASAVTSISIGGTIDEIQDTHLASTAVTAADECSVDDNARTTSASRQPASTQRRGNPQAAWDSIPARESTTVEDIRVERIAGTPVVHPPRLGTSDKSVRAKLTFYSKSVLRQFTNADFLKPGSPAVWRALGFVHERDNDG